MTSQHRDHERRYRSTILGACVLALLLAPGLASAQVMTPAIPLPGEEPTDTWVNLSYAHMFSTDTDLNNVEVQRESVLLLLGRRFGEPDDKLKFAMQFNYQLSAYNFFNDDLSRLGDVEGLRRSRSPRTDLQCGIATQDPAVNPGAPCGGKLWSDIHQYTFVGLLTYDLDEDWTLLGGAMFKLSGESGADFSEALTGGGFLGFTNKWSDNLSVGLLVGAISQIEDGVGVVPLPIVNWNFADSWKFKLGVQQLGGVGYGPELVFSPNEDWDIKLGASYQRRRFRLDNANGSTKNYIGDETSAPVYVEFNAHPNENVDLGIFAGVVVGGTIRMETQGGNKIFNQDYDPTATVGVKGVIRF